MQYPITPCYIFDEQAFVANYKALEKAFRSIYSNYHIAYSYKTNYTPYICKLVKSLGGYGEVVSSMEYELAKSIGYDDQHIIFNGPCKQSYPNCLLNVDSIDEIALTNSNIGLRVNVDIGANFISRFGIDEGQLDQAFMMAKDRIVGLHMHLSRARDLQAWINRANKMLELADKYFGEKGPEYIDLGSGMYGDMADELKAQFSDVPTYEEYAKAVALPFAKHYQNKKKPKLFTEPGTTLVNRYISFVCNVKAIKYIKGKCFVNLDGSIHNLGEICKLKKLPIKIVHNGGTLHVLENADLCGYTCLEQDIMYSGFSGEIGVGDYVIFENVGGYSLTCKPPFIRADYPMYTKDGLLIKRAQTNKEVFESYE